MNPYTEHEISNTSVIRTFKDSTESDDLKWHRDLEDREITSLNSNNWMIQLDDQLPVNLAIGKSMYIAKGVWHRLIKGKGNAIFKLNKNKI